MKWRKDKAATAEVKTRVLQKFFEAGKRPGAAVILENDEFRAFQEMIRNGEFDLHRLRGEDLRARAAMLEDPPQEFLSACERIRRSFQNINTLPDPIRFRPCKEKADPAGADPCKPNYYKTTIKGVVVTPWDVIDSLGLDFYLGNTLKYLWRFRDKGGILDLKKARTNLDKAIADLEPKADAGKAKA